MQHVSIYVLLLSLVIHRIIYRQGLLYFEVYVSKNATAKRKRKLRNVDRDWLRYFLNSAAAAAAVVVVVVETYLLLYRSHVIRHRLQQYVVVCSTQLYPGNDRLPSLTVSGHVDCRSMPLLHLFLDETVFFMQYHYSIISIIINIILATRQCVA